MAGDGSVTNDAFPDAASRAAKPSWLRRRRKVKVRKQTKFSRPVRLGLWLGTPVLLWVGIYFIGRTLL